MKILWFLDKEFDVALNVSARLATLKYLEKNNRVHVVTTFRKEKRKYEDFSAQVTYLDKINLPFLKTLYLFYQHLRFVKGLDEIETIDVVFINSSNPWLLKKLIKLRNENNFKLVLDIRTLPVDQNYLKKKLNNYFFRKSLKIAASHFDGITYITEEMREYCEEMFSIPPHQCSVWSSGVDIDIFKPSHSAESRTTFRLMYHGKFAHKRGIHNIVKAMRILNDPDIELFLLGSSEEMEELRKLVNQLRLEDRVFFNQTVPYEEVPDFINRVDAGVLPFPEWPAWNTSSPIKLFEYLACGKPVIVTKIPAHTSVLNGKDFAFWAKTSSSEDIARAISEAKSQKNNLRKIEEETRDFVEMNYSWEKQLSKLEIFLRSLQ
ncbi:MAG: glycosyltransferase family 4 protein [Candidatus Aminicenantes bacterium]|nr:MAG: glycosyltransferase family 4 protein [Candidatus Aminicenantes bacterium]